jgi:hypothetical protein
MQQQERRLDIASRLLSGLISQDRNRKLNDRIADIDHSLEVADELIRRSDGRQSPISEHALRPRPMVKTREQIVERDPAPLKELIAQRRPDAPTRSPRGPTLH